ncbi:MAG: sigma-70 family RNA polymerase sigma factor [Planctomycetes bacterium]|nr:sigma-70 family RNA polymerase sigma factor [Planctomycetota bacterium]
MSTMTADAKFHLGSPALHEKGCSLLAQEEMGVRRVIQRYIKDPATEDDIFQEVSIKVLRRIDTVREQKAIRGWLFQIARNSCLDYLRKQDRRPNNVQLLGINKSATGEHSRNPADQFCSQERIQAVQAALEQLPQSQREVIQLRLNEGLDHQAISERLNISRQAVEVRLCRGRSRLKNRLFDIMGGDL